MTKVDLGGTLPIGNASVAHAGADGAAGIDGVDEPALAAPGSCTAHAQTAYRLIQRRNLASPLRDPAGVACDGQKLWIFAGASELDGGGSPTLVRFDPDTLVVDRAFRFDDPIDFSETEVGGITWDGQAVWISISGQGNTITGPGDEYQSKIIRVDPDTGQVTSTFPSPTKYGPSDLDFDGHDLWLSTGTGDVYRIDPGTGSLEQHFPILPQATGRDWGIAFRSCELWVGEFFGGMEVHDPSTSRIVGMAANADGSVVGQSQLGGSCFVGNQLVIANRLGITFYDTEIAP